MAHNPINHPLRPTYRALGGLTGLYLVGFGAVGAIATSGEEFFAQNGDTALGQGTNLGFSVISIAIGAVILLATALGRNIDAAVNKWGGYLLMAVGLGGIAVIRTDANYIGFTMATAIVMMSLGLVLFMAGMYGKVGTAEEARRAHEARLVL